MNNNEGVLSRNAMQTELGKKGILSGNMCQRSQGKRAFGQGKVREKSGNLAKPMCWSAGLQAHEHEYLFCRDLKLLY